MRIVKRLGFGLAAVLVALAIVFFGLQLQTEGDITAFRDRVAALGKATPQPEFDRAALAKLPEPVQHYFDFVLRGPLEPARVVRMTAEGQFRRPLTEAFNPTTAEQVIAVNTPAMVFSETTTMLPGVWARAYDFFAEDKMVMKAKILSVLPVVDEKESAELNRISLRRWLIESALYPQGLLPGGPVSWEPIDDMSARVRIEADGLSASMIAHFDPEGRITHMVAEEDGDLTTPYHGSGEYVTRGDYERVGNLMIPMSFTISRAANGEVYPFWTGRITSIAYEQ